MKCDICGRNYGTDNDEPATCPECLRIIIANAVPEDDEDEEEDESDEERCPTCEEYESCCMCDPVEPEEEDLVTEDHVHFWRHGMGDRVPVVTVEEGEDWRDNVKEHMDRAQFWPNVWFISDHGNAHLLKTEGP